VSGVDRAMVDAMAADFAVVVAAVAVDSAANAVMVAAAVVVDSAEIGATARRGEIASPATDLWANVMASGAMIAVGRVEVETGVTVTAVDSAGAMTGIAIAVRASSLRPMCRD
jgi:hypothetical protein